MKRISFLVLIVLLFCSNYINAYPVVCPQTISCAFDSGACNVTEDWMLASYLATKPFPDNEPIALSGIDGYKNLETKTYTIYCNYKYGNGVFDGINIYQYAKNLSGINWEFSGFGKTKAKCSDSSIPEDCRGEF